ncbi:MAG: hypothetical protein FWC82_01460 [Firmicutes bacterium]|nr:hypothetical protein [Bacillota bacterium]
MKKKLIATLLAVGLVLSVAVFAMGCGNTVTLADLEGSWDLESIHIGGTNMDTFFTAITFDAEGNFTATPTVGTTTITGYVTLTGARIRFNSNVAAIDTFFNTSWEYRVRFVGDNMQWDHFLLGSRQNTAFVWNLA